MNDASSSLNVPQKDMKAHYLKVIDSTTAVTLTNSLDILHFV